MMHSGQVLTPDQERAREALGALATSPADPVFRARTRDAFVTGALGAPGRAGARLHGVSGRRAVAGSAWRWAAFPAAAAALFLIVGLINRGPGWRISASRGAGIAVIDGRPVPMNHTEDLARWIRPGARIRVPEASELELVSPRQIAMELTPGTDATVPQTPGRWYGRRVSAEVLAGEVRLMTGPRFDGARLSITTPAARVEVTGTTLAVICDPEGTCVCVLEGKVGVGGRDGPMETVKQGRRRFMFNDGRAEAAEIRPTELVQLGELRERKRALLERAGN